MDTIGSLFYYINKNVKFLFFLNDFYDVSIAIGNTFDRSQMNVWEFLLKMVKLNRFMIVNDEMRHVYSPASSSDTSDKIKFHVQAYLKKKITLLDREIFVGIKCHVRMFKHISFLIIIVKLFTGLCYQ
jgi:hypothetical protein